MNLSGRTAVITGGGVGFGLGIAQELVDAGARVFITWRRADKLAESSRLIGATPITADMTIPADWDRAFETARGVDILVNNAGAGVRIAPLAEQTDSEIASAVNINLIGVVLGSSRAAKVMSAKGSGAIVNVSSVCALHAWPGWSVYTAAKAGLSKFSHALHTEMRPFGVRVFCVTPSWGQTSIARQVRSRRNSRTVMSTSAIGRGTAGMTRSVVGRFLSLMPTEKSCGISMIGRCLVR